MQAFHHLFRIFHAKLFHLFQFCRVKKYHLFRFLSIQGFARFTHFANLYDYVDRAWWLVVYLVCIQAERIFIHFHLI